MKIDIHGYTHRAEMALKKLDNSNELSEKNKAHIRSFIDSCAADGLSMARIAKYVYTLRYWAIWLNKDFEDVKKEDMARVVTNIQMSEHYSAWSKQSLKIMIKRFYKWLKKSEEYPPEVKWIGVKMKLSERRLPGQGELISEEDVKKVLEVIEHPRDKALISMLWESGTRIGELCSLRLNNISIDKYGVLITVQGKTGSRKLRLVFSTQYLMRWLDMHPNKNDKSSPLWVNVGSVNTKEALKYRNISIRLKDYFKLAGINKRCYPHLFRHSRATYLANYLTEFQMNQYFGWVQGSNMPSTYVHLSGKEIDSAILSLNGIKQEQKKDEEVLLRPKKCPRCDTINNYDSKYCCKCAGVLDIKEAMELQARQEEDAHRLNETEELIQKISQNPQIIQMLAQKLQEVRTFKSP